MDDNKGAKCYPNLNVKHNVIMPINVLEFVVCFSNLRLCFELVEKKKEKKTK